MRLFLTTVVVLLTAVAASSMFEFAEEWNQWKLKHGKRYLSDQEEIERQKVWLANKKYIDEHTHSQTCVHNEVLNTHLTQKF